MYEALFVGGIEYVPWFSQTSSASLPTVVPVLPQPLLIPLPYRYAYLRAVVVISEVRCELFRVLCRTRATRGGRLHTLALTT